MPETAKPISYHGIADHLLTNRLSDPPSELTREGHRMFFKNDLKEPESDLSEEEVEAMRNRWRPETLEKVWGSKS